MDPSWTRAQHGEDLLLDERFGARRGGFFVEVGALDGELYSNTYFLAMRRGWTGVLVEANPDQAELCRRNRPESRVAAYAAVAPGAPPRVTLQVVEGQEGYSTLSASRLYARMLAERQLETVSRDVAATTLDAILLEDPPPVIDVVTIDVEGHEADVLRGFDLRRWRPTVVLVENASSAPDLGVAWQLFRAGYARRTRVVVNDWFEQYPLGPRCARLAWSYVSAVPDVGRMLVRESLRRVGLLERVRARRSRRRS